VHDLLNVDCAREGEMRMRHRTVDVDATSSAPPEVVFNQLVESATWPRWASIDSIELERAGDPPPDGVGAIRVLRRGRTTGGRRRGGGVAGRSIRSALNLRGQY
jgi:hypothetical protein